MSQSVLITGGAGYLGRAILRRAHAEGWDWNITILSRDEAKHIKVKQKYPDVRIIRGDVSGDVDDLTQAFVGHDIVIHAGANKLVDIGESAAFEVVRNNIIGSQNVARAAVRAGVKQVVGISSDKAVQPVNVYGMSKAVMERLFQEAATWGDTDFTCARYGNVVGSTISIVLYFKEQLATLGHIRVTNPDMTRFYMSADEAIDLILGCLDWAGNGSVVIPRMQAMSVADVANLVLGREPGTPLVDSRIRIVGARPGEKLHESLLHEQESVRLLSHASVRDYLELRPATEAATNGTPFAITSDDPPGGWMTGDRMLRLIEDAANV